MFCNEICVHNMTSMVCQSHTGILQVSFKITLICVVIQGLVRLNLEWESKAAICGLLFTWNDLAELTGNPWNQLFPMSQHLSSGLTHKDIGSTCLHMKDDKQWCKIAVIALYQSFLTLEHFLALKGILQKQFYSNGKKKCKEIQVIVNSLNVRYTNNINGQ